MLIGISGKARHGKDTFAAALGFKRVSFAGALKAACREVFGFTDAQLYGAEKETLDPYWQLTPRDVLQRVGVALRETIDRDVWVKSLLRVIQAEPGHYVIPDVRFPNEADAIKAAGGYIVRVERPGAGLVGDAAAHISETALDGYTGFDAVIVNDGSIEALQDKALTFLLGVIDENY